MSDIVDRLLEPDWHDPACPFLKHCYCDDGAPHDAVRHPLAREAADEIASLRARVEAMRETCARIAERDADRSNAVFEAGIGGDAGKDRNAARYRTALRIARAIRDTPVE